jgi:hypothetical protein
MGLLGYIQILNRTENEERRKFLAKKIAKSALDLAVIKLEHFVCHRDGATFPAHFFENVPVSKSLWTGFWERKENGSEFTDWLVSTKDHRFQAVFEKENSNTVPFVPHRLIADRIPSFGSEGDESQTSQWMAYAVEDQGAYPDTDEKISPLFPLTGGTQMKTDMGYLLRNPQIVSDENWGESDLRLVRSLYEQTGEGGEVVPRPFQFRDSLIHSYPVEHGIGPVVLQSRLQYFFTTDGKPPHICGDILLWNPYNFRLSSHNYYVTLQFVGPEGIPSEVQIKYGLTDCPVGLDKMSVPKYSLTYSFGPGEAHLFSLPNRPPSAVSPDSSFELSFTTPVTFEIILSDSSSLPYQTLRFRNISLSNISLPGNRFSLFQTMETFPIGGEEWKCHPRATVIEGRIPSQPPASTATPWEIDLPQIAPPQTPDLSSPYVLNILDSSSPFFSASLPPLYFFNPKTPERNIVYTALNFKDSKSSPFVLGNGRVFGNPSTSGDDPTFRYNSFFWDKYFFSDLRSSNEASERFLPLIPAAAENDARAFAKTHLQKDGINLHSPNLRAWVQFLRPLLQEWTRSEVENLARSFVSCLRIPQKPFTRVSECLLPLHPGHSATVSLVDKAIQESGLGDKITAPQLLSQMGDKMFVRSGTFTVYGYGEITDKGNKTSVVCKSLVQVVPFSSSNLETHLALRTSSFEWQKVKNEKCAANK